MQRSKNIVVSKSLKIQFEIPAISEALEKFVFSFFNKETATSILFLFNLFGR